MESPIGSTSETVSPVSSVTSPKTKLRKSKTKRVTEARVSGVDRVFEHKDYVEYEEDDEREGETGMPENTFLVKIQRLKEIIKLTKPQGEKKSKKRKMSKEDKDAAGGGKSEPALPMTEEELLEEKSRLIQELQDEIEMETYNTEQKVKLEAQQMRMRRYQLKKTWHLVTGRRAAFTDYSLKCLEDEEWLRYTSCDGLPDPAALPELNTFLYLWSLDDAEASMKTLPRQCEIVTYLIDKLDDIIELSITADPAYIRDCKKIRQKFRDKLQHWVDMASYCLLRHIERDTERIDLKNAKFVQQLTPLVCCFWALVRLPISMKEIPEKDRKPVEVSFDEVGLSVKMPLDLNCYSTAVRVLWYGYDHYSDLVASFSMPKLPETYIIDLDLLQFSEREWARLSHIREEQRETRAARLEEKRSMIEKILRPPPPPEKSKKSKKAQAKKNAAERAELATPPPPAAQLVGPEEIILQNEEEMRKESRRLLFTRCRKTEVNLRKYAILGGLYRIDLIDQPPQPKDMRREIYLTTLQLPKELELIEFARPYKAPPPAPDAERTPEVIEAEIKALEAAMEALALVTLKLPDSVLWFEPPLVAHWLPDEGVWSTEDVHDIKYNEEKQTIAFRTGRLGVHALAGFRYVNLPFQSWELKPEGAKSGGQGVVLALTGAIIQIELLVREDLVCLHSIAGGGSTTLTDMTGCFMKLHALIHKMRGAGCDFFPEMDAASYLKGLSLKHSVAGNHLQACMGLLSTAYVFSWSRWNATRGAREIVMQLKEVHGCIAKQRSNAMLLLVKPSSATIVNCSEVSSEFSDELADPNDKFYADVYHYALHNAGIKSRLAMKNISFKLSTTVADLLVATNVINFSA